MFGGANSIVSILFACVKCFLPIGEIPNVNEIWAGEIKGALIQFGFISLGFSQFFNNV